MGQRREPEYLVSLRAEGAGPPAHVRLKRWLKACLRCYGLRCTDVESLGGPGVNPDGSDVTSEGVDAGTGTHETKNGEQTS
jgi:hypothetical protein